MARFAESFQSFHYGSQKVNTYFTGLHVEAEPEEFDLAGDVVKVLAGLSGCFVLGPFPGRGGGSWVGC